MFGLTVTWDVFELAISTKIRLFCPVFNRNMGCI